MVFRVKIVMHSWVFLHTVGEMQCIFILLADPDPRSSTPEIQPVRVHSSTSREMMEKMGNTLFIFILQTDPE